MKKCILGILFTLTLCLTGCGATEPEKRTSTEVCGNLYITYMYNLQDDTIISKNVYDETTGITTEYVYYYIDAGHGEKLVGVNVITITKDGEIVGEFKNSIN